MDQSLSPISDSRNESAEVSRRLYRCMMETARQLDDHRSYAKTTRDLFTVQAEVLRVKLREYAERLMFSNTLGQGRKVEEVLWRKGFYDDVCIGKRLTKEHQWLPEERSQLQIHLTSGVGFYHHLLLRFQSEYGISFMRCIDFPMLFPDKEFTKSKVSPSPKQLESAKDSIHRCLVCLGDMCRYLMDISPSWNNGLAARYYYQALSLNPDIGMPHNQLGNLSGSVNFSLDAAYHYMRCLVSDQPFEGAEGNLKRILERNCQRLSEVASFSGPSMWCCHCPDPGSSQLSESQDNVQQLVSHFLLLVDVWFYDKRPVYNLSDLCHQVLLDFRHCLCLSEVSNLDTTGNDYTVTFPISKHQDNFPSYLSKTVVYKIIVMSLVCLFKLRNKGSDQASSAVAFLLAMFSFLVQQVRVHFKNSLFSLLMPISEKTEEDSSFKKEKCPELELNDTEIKEISNVLLNEDDGHVVSNNDGNSILNNDDGHVESDNSVLPINGNTSEIQKENKARKFKRIKRRQRRCSSEDSEHSENDGEFSTLSSASGASDDEVVVLDLSSDDEDKVEAVSEGGIYVTDDDVVVLEEAEEYIQGTESNILNGHANGCDFGPDHPQITCVPPDPVEVLEQVCGERLLPSIKVCADWLMGDTAVVQACGRDSSCTLKNFVELVSVINRDLEKLKEGSDAKLLLKLPSVLDSGNCVPLPEDILLQKLPILSKAHENLDWEAICHNCLNVQEEAYLRVQKLVDFCHYLATIEETRVQYNKEAGIFIVGASKCLNGDLSSAVSDQQKPSVDLERRGQLMQNMGQLWLRAEVQSLESSIKRGSKGASFSPYLVLDVDALTKYMQIVSHLMLSRKFIMIVPLDVLSSLDQMKRESVLARDAIRWLEFQFQKGSRHLRAQTASEALHLPLISYPKQKAREAWTYFKILECCHYLNEQNSMSRGKDSEVGLVTLLTGHEWNETSDFSPVGIAKAVGITLEHIEAFFAKWKTSTKSHG